jgi:hypothetical protein
MAEKRTQIIDEKWFKPISSVYTFGKNTLKTLRPIINLEKWRKKWPKVSWNYKLTAQR